MFLMVKSTGIVRKVDELGRIVLPIELRRTLGIAQKDALEIYIDQGKVIFKKYCCLPVYFVVMQVITNFFTARTSVMNV